MTTKRVFKNFYSLLVSLIEMKRYTLEVSAYKGALGIVYPINELHENITNHYLKLDYASRQLVSELPEEMQYYFETEIRPGIDSANTIRNLLEATKQYATDVSTLEAALQQRATDVSTLEAALQQRAADVSTLEAALQQRATDVSTLEAALQQRANDISALEQDLHNCQSVMEDQSVTIQQKASQIEGLQKRLNEIESTWLYRFARKVIKLHSAVFKK